MKEEKALINRRPPAVVAARLTPDAARVLDQLAAYHGRDRSEVVREAVDWYLAAERWRVAASRAAA